MNRPMLPVSNAKLEGKNHNNIMLLSLILWRCHTISCCNIIQTEIHFRIPISKDQPTKFKIVYYQLSLYEYASNTVYLVITLHNSKL